MVSEIPLSTPVVVFDIKDGLTSSNVKEQGLLACHYALSHLSNVSKSIFFINEVDPLLRFPEIVEVLETISKSENIQVIFVSQSINHFSKTLLGNFPLWLIGRMPSSEIPTLKKALKFPEGLTIHKFPKENP